jgi:AraC family transcriptional regulator
LVNALEETAHQSDIELIEHWNLTDRHITSVVLAMTTDLDESSPAERLYGESLANALAVYLLNRYTVRRYVPAAFRGGLPGYRRKRVLDHIGANVADDLSLSQLAAVAGMSPRYFAELFRQSTGRAPHRYVLLERIERAKQSLRDPKRSVMHPLRPKRINHALGDLRARPVETEERAAGDRELIRTVTGRGYQFTGRNPRAACEAR